MSAPQLSTARVTPAGREPGSTPKVWLVAEREITTRLRSKAFLVSTGILMLLVLASVVIGGIISQSGGIGGPTRVAASGEVVAQLSEAGFEVTDAGSADAAIELVRAGEVDVAAVPSAESPTGVTVYGLEDVPGSVVQALTVAPVVEILEPVVANPFLAYILGIGFGIVFMMSALTFGGTIAQSVVEEKQTRIVEILLATVSARTLLAGKVLGNSILALGQVVLIVALASVGMLATGQDLLFGELGNALIWFAVLFAFGFVLIATLYAATAALVSRQEDVASATGPVMWLVMIPYILVIVFNSNPQALAIMSYVPFSAPVGMPMRLYLGTAEWWEPVLSLAILLVTTVVVLLIGSRMYRNSILRTGGRVAWKDALSRAE